MREFGTSGTGGCRLRKDHDIQTTQLVLVTTKGLPGEALQKIPVGGSSNPLAGNGKPQAGDFGTVGAGEQRKVTVGKAARIFEDAPVMLRREQALPTAER